MRYVCKNMLILKGRGNGQAAVVHIRSGYLCTAKAAVGHAIGIGPFIWICDASPQANVSLHLLGPGEALLPALQRPGVLHSHPPANKNPPFQTPDGPNGTRDSTGRCQRWFAAMRRLSALFLSVAFCHRSFTRRSWRPSTALLSLTLSWFSRRRSPYR